MKIKDSEKRDKHLDLAREQKNVTMITIEVGALETIPKESIQELEDLEIREQGETVHTISLLRLARILRKVQET